LIVPGSLRLVGKKLVGLLYLLKLFLSFAALRLILDLVRVALENQFPVSGLDLGESRILLNSQDSIWIDIWCR
jgi:predicted transcriptional regulator